MSQSPPPPPLVLSDIFVVVPDARLYGPYPYSSLQSLAFAIIGFSITISLTACLLRVYSCHLAKGFRLDDWMIFIVTILATVHGIMAAFVIKAAYWGIHEQDIPKNLPTNTGDFWLFANSAMYNVLFALIKMSAVLYLMRIGGAKSRVRMVCRGLVVVGCLQMVVFVSLSIFQCLPVGSLWTMTPKERRDSPRCIRREHYAIWQAVINIITDTLTVSIPFWIFLRSQLTRRIRNALLGVFTLGALVTIMSAVRLYFVVRVYFLKPPDRKYSIGYVAETFEIHLAIVTVSAPALWPLARHWFPGMFASLGISQPYRHPDIEVGYETRLSSSRDPDHDRDRDRDRNRASKSRTLRAKIVWRDVLYVPGSSVARNENHSGTTLTDLPRREGGGKDLVQSSVSSNQAGD